MKATSAENHFPAIKKEIFAAAQADGRITVIDRSLSREDMLSLMSAIDCYVSLHRSEGFGLGMAEAMALEKPVIATDYSGNCEFVNVTPAIRFFHADPSTPARIYPHRRPSLGGSDEDACAAAMRDIVDHPDKAITRQGRTGLHRGPIWRGQRGTDRRRTARGNSAVKALETGRLIAPPSESAYCCSAIRQELGTCTALKPKPA